MSGAFHVVAPERVRGRTLIVIDDVMTTGTTVSECARVLKRAGAEKVFAATVARTLKAADAPAFSYEPEGEEVEAWQVRLGLKSYDYRPELSIAICKSLAG